jgi:anti-anti-sigma factor
MPGMAFSATTDKSGPDTVIYLHGDVNRSAQEGLTSAYDSVEDGPGRLLLDFEDAEYINSTGIALIVGILARARAQGRKVAAFGLTDHYRELFQITRLSDFMTIYDNQSAAGAGAN